MKSFIKSLNPFRIKRGEAIPKWQRLSKIDIVPPKPDNDRHGIAIAAIMKDEGDYVAEWAAFHSVVGVRHFYIYDNGSTDNTVSELRRVLGDAVTIIPWNWRSMFDARFGLAYEPQGLAYAHAIQNFGAAYRWMSFIDVDEFLVPIEGRDLHTALESLSDEINISLPWHNFGTSGHKVKPDGLVIENYTERYIGEKIQEHFKCIVDPTEVTYVRTHRFKTRRDRARTVNDAGQATDVDDRMHDSFYSAKRIQLNHYYTRSLAEFEEKLSKGRVSTIDVEKFKRNARGKLIKYDENTTIDRKAMQFGDIIRSNFEVG